MKILRPVLVSLAISTTSGLAVAQPPSGHGTHEASRHPGTTTAPYAGMQQREIKALSEQQMADLRAGKGLAMALPAELNGYPGPAHVLDLAAELKLSADQHHKTQMLFTRMQEEARTLGEQLIAAERQLDTLFRSRQAGPDTVAASTAAAAQLQGRLRATHLRYHLAMMDILTAEQVAMYQHIRGY
ncbi:hypothetical protein [Denitromonas iodatirespirans]|uniref:Periplasmic heavy metal sensor n=1 Tax=Denitromonas iodatirespirans TaxID=2795389 RepID=A0A944HBN4_DENI1|nr:hypothetical protein [Denitromonas iodatirespirans]MBT0960446.1 hypothetical protein [Denitromonas iodatirespirans]